jgi:hypothetical protein
MYRNVKNAFRNSICRKEVTYYVQSRNVLRKSNETWRTTVGAYRIACWEI